MTFIFRSIATASALAWALSAAAAEPSNTLTLVDPKGAQLTLNLQFRVDPPSLVTGTFYFGKWKCSGTVRQSGITEDGELVLRQKLDAGRCTRDCAIIVDAAISQYQERCGSTNTTAKGRFGESEPVGELRQHVAQMAQRASKAREARQAAMDAASRVPCWACNLYFEGMLTESLIGQQVYELDKGKFYKVTVTGIVRWQQALKWKQESTGKSGTGDAHLYYTETSKRQLESTWGLLNSLTTAKSPAPNTLSVKGPQPGAPAAWEGIADLSPDQNAAVRQLDRWEGQDPDTKFDGRTFFEAALVDRQELARVLPGSGMSRKVKHSTVQRSQFKTERGGIAEGYAVAFCSEGRPWCSGDFMTGEAILSVSTFKQAKDPSRSSLYVFLWMMNQTSAQSAPVFYCAGDKQSRLHCRQFTHREHWVENLPFTLRNVPGLGEYVAFWPRSGYAEAVGGYAAVDVLMGAYQRSMQESTPSSPSNPSTEYRARAQDWANQKPGRSSDDYRGP
jgi:hypothetical protein